MLIIERFKMNNTIKAYDYINEEFKLYKDEMEKKVKAEIKSGKKMIIKEVKTTAKKTFAPGLYDLTELQRDANKRFGYSAKETLNIMQRLYESHKVLTYPRTDSRYITTDVAYTLKNV